MKTETQMHFTKRKALGEGLSGRGEWPMPEGSHCQCKRPGNGLGIFTLPFKHRPAFSAATWPSLAFSSSLPPDDIGVVLPFWLVPATLKVGCVGERCRAGHHQGP